MVTLFTIFLIFYSIFTIVINVGMWNMCIFDGWTLKGLLIIVLYDIVFIFFLLISVIEHGMI